MKRTTALWITALVLGWLFDFLFWKHATGINFAIFALLCLAGSFLVLGLNGIKSSWKSLLLVVPILFFIAMTFLRAEPLSVFLAVVFSLGLMGLLAISYLGGRWPLYSLSDYVANFAKLIGSMAARPLIFRSEMKKQVQVTPPPEGILPAGKNGWKRFWAVFRGLLIALPVILIFAALLSSADPVFAARWHDFTKMFRLEKLPEYIFRAIYILVGAYALAGTILHAALKSRDEKLIGIDKPLIPAFLGFTEAAVVLGAVVVLFAVFVTIQFQYFFGGQANIHIQGYTYSEYARRGFGELVAVAFISLLLFLGLSAIVKRQSAAQRWTFSGLGLGMVALVGVMLVSAFQRLLLYESVYGFTRLRMYTHVFMIWLGLLLAVVVVLDLLRKERFFAFAALLASVGFAASLMILNVDAVIVRQNVARATNGEGLDVAYLASLSPDVVPTLAAEFQDASLPKLTRDAVGAVLVCRQQIRADKHGSEWQGFTVTRWQADLAIQAIQSDLDEYEIVDKEWPIKVLTPGNVDYDCYQQYGMD
jgi:hypothetical protein